MIGTTRDRPGEMDWSGVHPGRSGDPDPVHVRPNPARAKGERGEGIRDRGWTGKDATTLGTDGAIVT